MADSKDNEKENVSIRAEVEKLLESGGSNMEDTMASTSKGDLVALLLASINSLHQKFDVSLKQVQEDIHAPETGVNHRLNVVTTVVDNISEVSGLKNRVCKLEEQVTVLIAMLTKKEKEVNTLKADITDLRCRTMRDNLVITGVKEEEQEKLPEVVKDLFESIGIDYENGNSGPVTFDRMHRFGSRAPYGTRPIVAKVHDYQDKVTILDNAPKLKKTDADPKDKPQVFINNQFPEEINEKRKQAFAKIRVNKALPKALQSKMKLSLDKLYINGKFNKPKISRPTPTSVLSTEEEEKLAEINFSVGQKQSEKGNSFIGLAVKVNSIADVRRAYRKILRVPANAAASHVICGYVLDANTSGSCDDGEHGGGHSILRTINYEGEKKVAVFVIRHHQSTNFHLGPKRFEMIAAATKTCVQKLSETS